jgi:acyl-CoA synthetase (AMP-forming)/AMP-acid ligase II
MRKLDDAQVFLPTIWANHAEFYPGKTAVVCGEQRLTWQELNDSFNRVANSLLREGVSRGDKVAVVMTNSIEMLLIMFGISKAGACVVPISALLTPDQVAGLVDDSDARMVFVSESTRHLVDPVLTRLGKVESDKRISVGFEADGWRSYSAWLNDSATDEPQVQYRMDDDFNIIYSSGTTGIPKGIVQTHKARLHWSYSNALEMRFNRNSVALATTSLYANGTWFMLLPPMFLGATIVIMEQFSPQALLALVGAEKVTHTFMVPTQFISILEYPDFDDYDVTSLETMVSAGSPLRQDTKDQILTRIGTGLYELYGFSEGFATIIRPEDIDRTGSVGTPVLGFEIRILDDAGNALPRGEVGEIAGYGKGLMKEYYKRPDETSELIWRDEQGRTFLRSGDIGKLDEDGFLYILDRKKDMILSGGFNVFPKDVEAVLGRHDDVSDVAVIGVPHPKWGEVPLALIVPKADATPDLDVIKTWANERLAKPQRVSAVEIRGELPRNALGKVLKRELRKAYWTKS